MKITSGILFYLLDKKGAMQHICHGADRTEISHLEYLDEQVEVQSGVLYIHSDKKGVLLFCTNKKYKTSTILAKALTESKDAFSSLWISHVDTSKQAIPNEQFRNEVTRNIEEAWNVFSQFQNDVLEGVVSQEKPEIILDKAKTIFKTSYYLVDRNMDLIYESLDYQTVLKASKGEYYEEQIIDDLLIAKEFHEVAAKKEPFYYFIKYLGCHVYCNNIIVDDVYYARFIVYAENDKQTISSGEEQVANYLSELLRKMIRLGSVPLSNSNDDQMHIVLQRLINGNEPGIVEISHAIEEYHWEKNHLYQAVFLEHFKAAGWEMQIENTMPSMIRKLEQAVSHSCAVFSENKILWLINYTLSDNIQNPYDQAQKLIVLLRDNVLRAGASSTFNDICLLHSATKEAQAALEIGTKKNPSYWIYRFDDYRLSYMLDMICQKNIDPMLLINPAIPILMEYDKTHENELSKTLETLVDKRGNVTQAAEALYIHRTTLFRRLNQIKELTGIDMEEDDLMLELQLSYKILHQ